MNNEVEIPIRLFPVAYPVDEVYHPLLNAIARAHPETFARFIPQSPRLGSILLRDLHDLLMPWAQLRFDDFTLATETAMQVLTQDLADLVFDLGWLTARGPRESEQFCGLKSKVFQSKQVVCCRVAIGLVRYCDILREKAGTLLLVDILL